MKQTTKRGCSTCAHLYVCMYSNSIAELLRIVKAGKTQFSITDGNLDWAIAQTKKAIGGCCKYYLKKELEDD